MKSEEALIGIAVRTNGKTTDCASTLKFSAVKADQQTFDAILYGLMEEFPAFWRGPREYDESEMQSFDCLFLMLIEQLQHFPEKPEEQSSAIVKILALSAFLEHEDQLWPVESRAKLSQASRPKLSH